MSHCIKQAALCLLAVTVFMGCSALDARNGSGEEPKRPSSPEATTQASSPAESSESYRKDGLNWSSRAYPTGNRSTSTLLVETGSPSEVVFGQSYDYLIKVTNLSSLNLDNVVVLDKPLGNFKLKSSTPNATRSGDSLRWNIGNLRPRQAKTIRVTGAPAGTGAVTHCCEADWSAVVCSTTQVVQPKLALVKSGTTAALSCDPISYKLTVTNDGSGPARNVVIEDVLPAGLTTLDGKQKVSIKVGTLAAGKSRSYNVRCKANRTGSFANKARATADGLTASSGTVSTVVTKPTLTITKTGTKQIFMGRNIDYTITVKNTGNGIAKNAVLEDPVPSGAKFISATEGGKLNRGVVRWSFGTLKPGESRKVSMSVKSTGAMTIRNAATVKAYCAEPVSASVSTTVTGIAAILLEVVDLDDPIEVGGNETYVITATNQGSAPGTNITIVCEIEDTMTFLSATGATRGSASGRVIKFMPLRSLGPKKKASWKVVVKAKGQGDVRFRVRMTSDQLTRSVDETEATNFYK